MVKQGHWPILRRAQWEQGEVGHGGKDEEREVGVGVVVVLGAVEELVKLQLPLLPRRLSYLQNSLMPIRMSTICWLSLADRQKRAEILLL
jgi:hypothetical protein